MTGDELDRRHTDVSGPPTAGVTPEALRALWPWIGEVDRLVDGDTGWDVFVVDGMDPLRIEVDHGTATIRVGDREHLRRMMRAEADRYAAQLEAERAERRRNRLEREASARAIRNTIPPYRDPDVIPDARDCL